MTNRCSRLAPSPTGALHLGNARTFLVNWALARRLDWSLLMRMEDLDGPRIKAGSIEATLDLLQWLGLDWDGPVTVQSADLDPYRAAMRTLSEGRRVFSCDLSRREIEAAASAPHRDDRELRYPPELRPDTPSRYSFDHEETNYRLIVAEEIVHIDDEIAGPTDFKPSREVGDFVVWTRRGQPSYQLAVVVDDARQGVTDVVRGDDLLPSAARQTLLYRALGLIPPRWWHLPLIVGPDGRRLAKRHGDTRLDTYRQNGVAPERIIGLLASWSGVLEPGQREALCAADFRDRFTTATLPPGPITLTKDDERWLRSGC